MADLEELSSHRRQNDALRGVRHFLEECLGNCKRQGKRYFIDPETKEPTFCNAYFYPYEPLEEYFLDTKRVEDLLKVLLNAEETIKLQPEKIAEAYVQIFAILIVIGEGKWIQYFVEYQIDDGKLPFLSNDIPDFWPRDTSRRSDFWRRFREEQWTFCPHRFRVTDLHTNVNPSAVLPLKSCEILDARSGGTVIYKVEIYPDYHGLYSRGEGEIPKVPSLRNKFVIKSLDSTESQIAKRYEQEVSAFNVLGFIPMPGKDRPSDEIVRCYGSFVQNNTYNILLEFADKGDLSQFFETVSPPVKPEQMTDLWNAAAKIASGVYRIHCVARHGSIHQGYHQDMKPANILVFSNGEESPYRYTFKIADLGLSYFLRREVYTSDPQGPAEVGSRTYGSPEKFIPPRDLAFRPFSGQASDIWSVACIYSVLATWMVSGKEGIREFAERRSEARCYLSKDSIDCFHDDHKILEVVETWHSELCQDARERDMITKWIYHEVLALAFEHEPGVRCTALQLYSKVDKLAKLNMEVSMRDEALDDTGFRTPSRGQSQSDHRARHIRQYSSPRSGPSPTSIYEAGIPQPRPYGHSSSPEVFGNGMSDEPGQLLSETRPFRRGTSQFSTHDPFRTRLLQSDTAPSTPIREMRPQVTNDTVHAAQDDDNQLVKHDSRCPMHYKTTRPPPPFLSVEKLLDWKARRDSNGFAVFPDPARKEALKNHDHVFIVDDSRSMKAHWKELLALFAALTKFVKDCDPDGLELYTTVSAKQPVKSKHSSKLLERVKELRNSLTEHSKPEIVLRKVLDDHREKIRPSKSAGRLNVISRQRETTPLCIYMFTDGVWQADTRLDEIITDYVNFMDTPSKLPDYHIGIQFIRFGHDSHGVQRLEHYDKLGKNAQYGRNYGQDDIPLLPRDIVDTEPSNGNVWKMLLGAIDKLFDDDNACICRPRRPSNSNK